MGMPKKRSLASPTYQSELGLQKIKRSTKARKANKLMLYNNKQRELNRNRGREKFNQSKYHCIALQTDRMTEQRSYLLN
jgi:hypothetical protein